MSSLPVNPWDVAVCNLPHPVRMFTLICNTVLNWREPVCGDLFVWLLCLDLFPATCWQYQTMTTSTSCPRSKAYSWKRTCPVCLWRPSWCLMTSVQCFWRRGRVKEMVGSPGQASVFPCLYGLCIFIAGPVSMVRLESTKETWWTTDLCLVSPASLLCLWLLLLLLLSLGRINSCCISNLYFVVPTHIIEMTGSAKKEGAESTRKKAPKPRSRCFVVNVAVSWQGFFDCDAQNVCTGTVSSAFSNAGKRTVLCMRPLQRSLGFESSLPSLSILACMQSERDLLCVISCCVVFIPFCLALSSRPQRCDPGLWGKFFSHGISFKRPSIPRFARLCCAALRSPCLLSGTLCVCLCRVFGGR